MIYNPQFLLILWDASSQNFQCISYEDEHHLPSHNVQLFCQIFRAGLTSHLLGATSQRSIHPFPWTSMITSYTLLTLYHQKDLWLYSSIDLYQADCSGLTCWNICYEINDSQSSFYDLFHQMSQVFNLSYSHYWWHYNYFWAFLSNL